MDEIARMTAVNSMKLEAAVSEAAMVKRGFELLLDHAARQGVVSGSALSDYGKAAFFLENAAYLAAEAAILAAPLNVTF